jgi:U3 small nucleolar RNA-associated protein 20
MVLYNDGKIMDLLATYIEKGDALAMEPLLNLLSHFAHDLDTRFEKHFQKAVATVASVAAKHPDFAVIEWSFTCLAWLFKYLSRLLTPDLRPLYDLLAPYLGRETQKPFIVRFTAEALSFLVRKAAAVYERDPEPLDLVIGHMLRDCKEADGSSSADLLQQGTMTLITEAVKGVQHGIHTSGVPVMKSLIKHAEQELEGENLVMDNIASGVVTSLIHHCMSGSFQAILDLLLAHAEDEALPATNQQIRFRSRILFTAVSVRKGSRVSDWKAVMGSVEILVKHCTVLPELESSAASAVLALLSVTLQTATVDAVLARRHIFETLRAGRWAPYFLLFCDMTSRLGSERFDSFVLPQLQKFVQEDTTTSRSDLFAVLPRLAKGGKSSLRLKCPEVMVDTILADVSNVTKASSTETTEMALAQANTALAALPFLVVSIDTTRKLESMLLDLVMKGLKDDALLRDFALGPAFQHFLELNEQIEMAQHLWVPLCNASPDLVTLPRFWSNLLCFVKKSKPADLQGPHMETLEDSLISCLSVSSHPIRQNALDILQQIYMRREVAEPESLAAAITIESTPISLDTSRSISMNVRRLAAEYGKITNDDLIIKAVPAYCFGLLHVNLSQAWEDATEAISSICQSKKGEDAVMALAQLWIDGKTSSEDDDVQQSAIVDVNTDGFKVFSDFECPNLAKLSAIWKQVFEEPSSGLPTPRRQLSIDSRRIPLVTANARSQALRVLHKIPHIAEKRSRILVPVLLKWAGPNANKEEVEGQAASDRWARKDQKSMLAIFAQFVNPGVLFRSNEVHDALLELCANGDVEIQQSALKAILSWKDPSVIRYKEHLNNLLDEESFRDEISVFLRDGSDEDEDAEEAIRPEDHARLMPILLRLLYGRAIAGGKEGQAGRRKAIFVALSRFGGNILEQFLDIALGSVIETSDLKAADSQSLAAPLRQQLGMMYMTNDMLQVLGAELEPFVPMLINGILACTVSASNAIQQGLADETGADMALERSIRQTGIQCLVKVFSTMTDFDPTQYGQIIVKKLIQPRLDSFANENAQSISGILRLVSAWSKHNSTAQLLTGSSGVILERIAELLHGQYTKDEVRLFVLQEVLDSLVDESIAESVLQPTVSNFVKAIGLVIEQQPTKEVLDACVKSFSKLAERITSKDEAIDVTRICTDLLKRPGNSVAPWIKIGLLQTILPLISRFDISAKDSLYDALCALFSRLRSAEGRILLARVLATLVRDDAALLKSAELCDDMNAMGSGRLDEPDHDRRERAFAQIYENSKTFTLEQWLPIVHNCLYYIRDGEDRVNRTSSSHALQLFIDAVAVAPDNPAWLAFTEAALLSGIERGMGDPSELVRAEYLLVLGHLVEKLSTWPKVGGMQGLLVGGDEEASIFINVLHIQQHRRLRALRRLSDEASNISSTNVSRIFFPLLEHFVFDQIEGDAGRTLADQSVQTIGALSKALNKNAYRATFQRYTSYLKTKEDSEKTILRLLGAMVDGVERAPPSPANSKAIIGEQLPPLLEYLHKKDESTVDRRMPVAVTIVKLMLGLTDAEFAARLPAVLTDVSHVLRSKSQEARDQTRKALTTISTLVGSSYFGFILKELRSALQRGPQLHVLSYTVHSLLVDGSFEPGDLDECLPALMRVIMDDIFGETGQEKDAEEYKSGMKEVKSSKSFDTMELLARATAVNKLGELVRPIRQFLSEKLDMKMVKKIDELLTRLRKGLDQNPASETRDMLSFCWQMVDHVRAEEAAIALPLKEVDERRKRFLIQPEEPKKSKTRGATASYLFKLTGFSFNLLRKVLRRHEDLQTPQNLKGFLPMTGDALVSGQEEVKVASLRLLSTIMRVQLPELEENAPVYVKEAVNMIKGSSVITTDASKASLELVTSVLREKRSVVVKEKDMALLLKRLKTDIDEPDRQGVVYKFLRAVLGRKIVITEVYEVMDEVGKAMVINPDRSIRESARSAYLQFVMEYPQGKDRWQKHTAFLVGNLAYDHAAGRQSVMEFLHQMLTKVGEDVLAEVSPKIFNRLQPLSIGDNDSSCRDMAKLLIGKLFERASEKTLATFLSNMDVWLWENKPTAVKAAALQDWSILLKARQLSQKQVEGICDKLEEIVSASAEDNEIAEPLLVIHALNAFTAIVSHVPSVGLARTSEDMWQTLQNLPSSADPQIQESVATLLGTFFTDVASTSSKTADGLAGLPLLGSGGLEVGAEDMRRLCAANLRAIRAITLHTSEALAAQIVRNVVFLGRCFAANEMPWYDKAASSAESSENEEDEVAETGPTSDKSALSYLLRRLSTLLRADKFSLAARTASLATISALLNQLPATSITPSLHSLLRPLYALTDPSVPKPPGDLYKALTDNSHEVLELIQKKVGPETYVAALAVARTEAKARRDERRQKRRIEAVAAPEKWAKEKKRRYEVKKASGKRKGEEARGKRRGW